ncbi:YceI family protein [Flavobacterium sp. WC2509]|uniref:YceI family protein n=1 Tax=Flavobacterium sp. WC2509 TaxID=3461406 RepID=UPI0040445274
MKKIILIIMLSSPFIVFSQEKLITKSGTIIFDASFPSFDEVRGTNSNVTFVLNPTTGEIASLAIMKGFQFEIALMEEHFNENYMETDQYPKAIFRGQIEGFDTNNLTGEYKDYIIKGKLELHGKSKEINANARISKTGSRITIFSSFPVNTSDFSIPIPALIKYKLASKVNIKISAVLIPDFK